MEVGRAVSAIVDAFRNRAAEQTTPGHSLSFSQQISLSQAAPRSDARSACVSTSWLGDVQDVLGQLKEDQLPKLVLEAKEGDVPDLLKALQQACAPATQKDALCLSLAEACIRDPNATAGRRGREIFSFVSNQADMLGANDCGTILMTMLDAICNAHENLAKVIEIMPKLLLSASKEPTLKVKKMSSSSVHGDGTMVTTFKGSAFREHVFTKLCGNSSTKWPQSLVVALLTTIKDLQPDEQELKMVVRKVHRESGQLELQELPPLVYQLLLLSTHGKRQAILEMILDVFNALDNKCSEPVDAASQLSQITESRLHEDELIHVEGTVIHHFVFALRQDTVLAKELLNVLRLRQCSFTTFELALLFSMVRIDRYSTKASDMLRKAFLQDFAHEHKLKSSAWISSIHGLMPPSSMRLLCASVLRKSVKGWDQVVPGIVTFAMSQLEWAAKKCSTGSSFGRPAAVESTSNDAPVSSAASAGSGMVWSGIVTSLPCSSTEMHRAVASQLVQSCSEMLEKVFRQHTAVRDEILGQILSRVLTRDESVKYVVHLLARITSRCSKDVIDCLPKIKESLEYLSFMPPSTAVALIRAIQPVLRLSASLLDYLIIILRKALFSREENARLVALQGFLFLAEGNLAGTRASAASASSAASPDASIVPHDQDPLALEIIGQLRRTMAQQVQMRERLYDGLCDIVRAKPHLIDDVAAALFPQLQKYCHSDGSSMRIMLERCVDENNGIIEPIGKLLRAVAVCVALKTKASTARLSASVSLIQDDSGEKARGKEAADEDEGGVMGAARSYLDKLAGWIADSDPEDFDMDKETDFSSNDTPHLSCARLLVGMYEVLFEHMMLHPQVKVGQETRLFKGIGKMYTILDLVSSGKPGGKGAGKGRKGSTALDDRTSLFSYEFARQLLVGSDVGASGGMGRAGHVDLTADSAAALRKAVFDDDKIMSLALETAQRHLVQAGRSIVQEPMLAQVRESQHGDVKGDRAHIIKLAPLLLRQFYLNLASKRASSHTQLFKGRKAAVDKDADMEMSLAALHGLQMCVQLACSHLSKAELGELAALVREEFESINKRRSASVSGVASAAAGSGEKYGDEAAVDVLGDPFDARITKCILALQQLCRQLLEDEETEYAAMTAETIYILQGSLSLEAQTDHEPWAQGMCKNPLPCGSDHQALAKALLANLLRLTQSEPGLDSLVAVGKDMEMLFRMEDDDDGADEQRKHGPASPEYDIVREDNRDLLFALTTDAIKACCEDVEWVWDALELSARPDLTDSDDLKDSPQVQALIMQTNAVEDAALQRLTRVVDGMLPLALSLECEYCNKELVVKALTRVYHAAEHVAKKVEQRRGVGVRNPFQQLMMRIGTQLHDALYSLLLLFDVATEEKTRGKRQKISNESRLVPQLVYQVEMLEAHLIKIQKMNKSLDLMKHFKRSTARDFKIDFGVVQKLAKDEEDEGQENGKDAKKKGKGAKKRGRDRENLSSNTQGSRASKVCRDK